jgi:hypothetical protein
MGKYKLIGWIALLLIACLAFYGWRDGFFIFTTFTAAMGAAVSIYLIAFNGFRRVFRRGIYVAPGLLAWAAAATVASVTVLYTVYADESKVPFWAMFGVLFGIGVMLTLFRKACDLFQITQDGVNALTAIQPGQPSRDLQNPAHHGEGFSIPVTNTSIQQKKPRKQCRAF